MLRLKLNVALIIASKTVCKFKKKYENYQDKLNHRVNLRIIEGGTHLSNKLDQMACGRVGAIIDEIFRIEYEIRHSQENRY